jgi:hypothetical protein
MYNVGTVNVKQASNHSKIIVESYEFDMTENAGMDYSAPGFVVFLQCIISSLEEEAMDRYLNYKYSRST